MSELKLKGRITISRVNSNIEDGYMKIAVTDDDSGIEFCTVKMTLSDFTNAITGRGYLSCKLSVRGLDKVGTQGVSKVENVKRLKGQSAKDAIKPYEVDGWVGRSEDAENHHRISEYNNTEGYTIYRVAFFRWVDKDECDHESSQVDK